MASKPWAVVLFEDENSVATVPDIWLTKVDCKDVAFWPTNTRNITNKVKRRDEPGDDWSQFKCKILGFYDRYETALKKSLTAEDKLELTTSASEENQIRKRKINKKYHPTSSSSDSDSSEIRYQCQNKYPKVPKKLTKSIDEKEIHCDTFAESNEINRNIFKKKPMGQTIQLYSPTPSTSSFTGALPNSNLRSRSPSQDEQRWQIGSQCAPIDADSDFKRQIFNKLNIITAKLAHHDECFDSLRSLLDTREHNDNGIEVSGESCDHLLPLNGDEELRNLNEIISNVDNCKRLAKALSLIGGESPEELTKKIMYRVITSEFAQLYSWEGGKGKRKFCDLSLSKVIFDAVRLNKRIQNACDDQIIKTIKKFLVKAKERVTNKQKRKSKTLVQPSEDTEVVDEN